MKKVQASQEQAEQKVSAFEGRLREMDQQLKENQRIATRAQDGCRPRSNLSKDAMRQNVSTAACLNKKEVELKGLDEELHTREQELLQSKAEVSPAMKGLDESWTMVSQWKLEDLNRSSRSETAEIERVKEERTGWKSERCSQPITAMDPSTTEKMVKIIIVVV